jgi:hypothetical protein
MLANTYGWFTEGFDTADLKDAKALLNEWSAQDALFEVRDRNRGSGRAQRMCSDSSANLP